MIPAKKKKKGLSRTYSAPKQIVKKNSVINEKRSVNIYTVAMNS